MNYCFKCGARINYDMEYCPNCGINLKSEENKIQKSLNNGIDPVKITAILFIIFYIICLYLAKLGNDLSNGGYNTFTLKELIKACNSSFLLTLIFFIPNFTYAITRKVKFFFYIDIIIIIIHIFFVVIEAFL